MSLLEFCPVTPGNLAGEFLISRDVLLSPSRVTPGALSTVTSLLELLPSRGTPGTLAG